MNEREKKGLKNLGAEKMKKGITKKLALVAIIAMFAVLAVPVVSADYSETGFPVATIATGSIHGNIYYEVNGVWPGTRLGSGSYQANTTFDVPDETIITARLYTGVWGGSPHKTGNISVVVNQNTLDTREITGNGDDTVCNADTNSRVYGTGCGVWANAYDVTSYITAGATNTVNITTKGPACPASGCCAAYWDGRIYTAALVVVYQNDSMPEMTYWLNEGTGLLLTGDSTCGPGYTLDNFTAHFNGTVPSNVNVTKLWTLGFPNNCQVNPELNGNNIGDENYTESGSVYEFYRWDNLTAYLDTENPSNNSLYYYDPTPYYDRVQSAVFMAGRQSGSDLAVTSIEPKTLRPNKDSTINATITNVGNVNVTTAFNVKLYINDVLNGTQSIQRLNASESKTVSFTQVNESEGCYTFKVVADADGAITEVNENNNATSKKYQVGYVIEVESKSDFDDLVTESQNGRLPANSVTHVGDTYHIQNLTIENCAGSGISIENTNVKFVINNCTVHNCTRSGVYFRNLTNGTVNGSKMQNNTEYGINVYGLGDISNTKLINITNNTINGSKIYGIDLIGCNCTVKNNTISNSTTFGIYLFGNYSNITNNTIRDNTDYGIKAYNSYNNNIYCNTFTGNNDDSSGHQAWDNGNTNYWNSTELSKNYVGNRWKDWDDNSGFPSNYTIDGGSNVDKRPKGLYDFLTGASDDKWAYGKEVSAKPPTTNGLPSDIFLSLDYGNIKTDNEDYKSSETETDTYYAAHRFNFSISESASEISKINVTWNGKGWHDNGTLYNGTQLYLYNFSATSDPYYDELASTTSGIDATLTGENATAASNYVNAGNVTVLVVQKSAQSTPDIDPCKSHIETDYVRVVITL